MIDAYLAEIDQRLLRLPADRRAAEREELAQHLDLLVTAYRARGMDGDAAARASVDRLGPAGPIGTALQRAGRRDHPAPMDYVRMFGVYAVVWTAMSTAVDYAFHRIAGWPRESLSRAVIGVTLMSALLVYANIRRGRVEALKCEGIDA
jgi:hypothetical protein